LVRCRERRAGRLFLFPYFFMAKFRKVNVSFWDDTYIERLSAEDRYFFLFLLTNPHATECGIYQISHKKMSFYTGYNEDAVRSILKRFIETEKVAYNPETSELAILNKANYIERLGTPVIDCLKSELSKVSDKKLVSMVCSRIQNIEIQSIFIPFTDTPTSRTTLRRQEEEEEEDKEEEQEQELFGAEEDEFERFWNLYDKKVDKKDKLLKKWKALSKKDRAAIFEHIPKYKEAQPDKRFRKNPLTYINNESWNDEIIKSAPAKTIPIQGQLYQTPNTQVKIKC